MNEFKSVARLSDLPEGKPHAASLSDAERLCLVRVGEQVFAFEDRCSHAEFPMSAGDMVDDYLIECALHGARFDIRDGTAVELPATEPLSRFEVKIEDGTVWVRRI